LKSKVLLSDTDWGNGGMKPTSDDMDGASSVGNIDDCGASAYETRDGG